jgi:Leucine-rich repeat (LRR) protein
VVGLALSGVGLRAALPESIGRLTALTALDLSHNGLTGPLPGALAQLVYLKRSF